MEAKEFLNQVRNLDKKIKKDKSKAQNLRLMAESISSVKYDKDPVQSSRSPGAPFENMIVKAIDLEEEIAEEENQLVIAKQEVANAIARLDNSLQQAILIHRYINLENWDDVAKSVGYSKDYTYQMHRWAVDSLHIPA